MDALDRIAAALEQIAAACAAVGGTISAAMAARGDDEGPATDTPRRRGRKPGAEGGAGVAATAPQPGATAQPASSSQSAQSVAQPAQAAHSPELGGFAGDDNTDPFGEPAKGN